MRYRRFGKTELVLSEFSLGTMRCLETYEKFQATVTAAIALGINHIETARGYGNSERFLGKILSQLDAETQFSTGEAAPTQLVITTKIPPTPDAATFAQQIDESLARLQQSSVDCLALHGINTEQHLAWVTDESGCMAAVRDAIAAGKIRHVGFSTHGSLEIVQAAIATGLFEFVNLHYYYFFQRLAPAVALAHQQNMGVFIISPGDKGGMLYKPPETLQKLCEPFSPLALTYQWLLQDERITTLSTGPAGPQELAFISAFEALPAWNAQMQAALNRLEQKSRETLGGDRCAQCYQCLPCPESINIPEMLRLRNLAVAYDMTAFGEYRYAMFEHAGHWFPGRKGKRCTDCGDCLPRCPEDLKIPTLLRDTHKRLNGPERRRLWG
ncbi:MAG: aldo/keto reductase [Cyanobacteria bacterium P01_A01_bin.123]